MSSQQYIVSVFANDGQRSLGIEAEFNELANYMGDWNQMILICVFILCR
ncbi:MAG: hypothetical protein R3B93_11350 [Bacteroidia bacterium]